MREILAAGELEDEGAEAARAVLTVLEAETAPSVRRITLRHALDTIKVGGDIARLQALIEAVLGTIT